MILQARDALDLDLSRSLLVGDKASDIEAGIAAGVGHNLLLVADEQHDPARLMFASLGAIGAWLGTDGAQPETEGVPPPCEPSPESGK
jgi:phosphoglycolate phosphatase-like HAD superfamily hydrolase